jgi:hypothetical protein
LRFALFAAWLAALLLAVLSATLLLAVPIEVAPFVSIGDVCLVAPLYFAVLAYAAVVGLPAAALLRYRRWTHPLVALTVGLLLGGLPALMFRFWSLALMGAIAAAIFRATLQACGVLATDTGTLRPRLSFALAGLAIVLTMLTLSLIPPCEISD